MKTIAFVVCIVCLLSNNLEGKNLPAHNELWSRIYISHKFTTKIRGEAEYQYRWQNTPDGTLPTWKLLQGARAWGYYQINPIWTVGLSPFAWFRSYPLLNTESDFQKRSVTELRFTAGGEWKKPIAVFELKARVNYESRSFNTDGNEEWTRKDRIRGRAVVTLPLVNLDSSNKDISFFVADEYFYQGENGFTESGAFDQNRISAGIVWKLNKSLKFDLIYMDILRNNSAGDYIEKVLWISSTLYL